VFGGDKMLKLIIEVDERGFKFVDNKELLGTILDEVKCDIQNGSFEDVILYGACAVGTWNLIED
jgi:hypothetical protein